MGLSLFSDLSCYLYRALFLSHPTERSDEGSRDLSHTFKMTLYMVREMTLNVVRDDI